MLRRSDANEEGTRGERECRNKTTEGKMKASGACCAALKMSIIDPRKGNEIQRPNIKKSFPLAPISSLQFPRFDCLRLRLHPRRSPIPPSITFSCLGYSTRNHPFFSEKSARKAIVSSHQKARRPGPRQKNVLQREGKCQTII
jgi:hypothetical protein